MDKSREIIERMISDALRASEVIKRIRALLKKNAPEKEWLDINETLREVISLAAGELVKNRVLLRTELEEDLPPVLGDQVQLQQVVLNLILNAVQAMSGEGWQPRELLVSSQRSKPEEVRVGVGDSGPGLGVHDAERIFDPFFTTKEGGLGLGLSIGQTIIENHEGRALGHAQRGARHHFPVHPPHDGRKSVLTKVNH